MDDPPFLLALRVDTVADDRVSVGGYGGRLSQRPPGKRGAQTIMAVNTCWRFWTPVA